jgi:imidazolonepropionase-like amidohydrolase
MNIPAMRSLLALVCLPALQLPSAPEHPYAIVGASVLDVDAGVLRPDWTVLIEDERITAAGPRASTPIPAGTPVRNGAGLILAPGLFDTHIHFVDPDAFAPAMVANGVLFARDLGSETSSVLALREALRSGKRLGPELIVTGAIVDGDPAVWPFSAACADADAARKAVAKLADAGVDQIKVYSRLSPEAFHAAVAEAKARGLIVGGHVPDSVSLGDALAAGMDFSEHLMGWERLLGRLAGAAQDEFARGDNQEIGYWRLRESVPAEDLRAAYALAAQAGTYFAPTLVVMEGVAGYADPDAAEKDPRMAFIGSAYRAFWRNAGYSRAAPYYASALPHQKALVKDMHNAGVTLVCGTDLANPLVFPGFSLHREMELFQECGIAPADVIRCATVNAARLCGVENRLGRVRADTTASLVLLRANPLLDVRNYAQIEAVVLRGRWFDRAALDGLLTQAREAAEQAVPYTGEDEPEMASEIPGEPIHRGRYQFTFADSPVGFEEFLWTQDAEGWHLQARLEVAGGFAAPARITVHYGLDRNLLSATWRRPDGTETATYRVESGKLFVRGGAAGEEQEIEIVLDGAAFGPDAFSADLFALPALGLQAEGEVSGRIFGFGAESWKPVESSRLIRRDPDKEVEWGGKMVTVSVYSGEYTTNGQKMKTRTWVGPNGLPLKSAFSFPFGKFEAKLRAP